MSIEANIGNNRRKFRIETLSYFLETGIFVVGYFNHTLYLLIYSSV